MRILLPLLLLITVTAQAAGPGKNAVASAHPLATDAGSGGAVDARQDAPCSRSVVAGESFGAVRGHAMRAGDEVRVEVHEVAVLIVRRRGGG